MLHRLAPLLCLFALAAQARAEGGIFVGTTPCGAAVRQFLGLPAAGCDLVRWELSLGLDAKTAQPGPAVAQVEYGLDGKRLHKLRRPLTWELGVGAADRKDAKLVELKRGKASLKLWKLDDETLHFLDAKQRLLVGDADHSYALSVAVVDKLDASTHSPDSPLPQKALPTGPTVYGVFEGTTPCDIAHALNVDVPADCGKVRWRVTLYQDATTRAPTRYLLESALSRSGPREGTITLLDGTPFDPLAKVFKLDVPPALDNVSAVGPAPAPLYLLRGDENVLVFLDGTGKLNLGNRYYNYVLNRRKS